MPFPNLALLDAWQPRSAQAVGAPDPGPNVFQLGIPAEIVDLERLHVYVLDATDVTDVSFVAYDPATNNLTLDFAVGPAPSCRIRAWMPTPEND